MRLSDLQTGQSAVILKVLGHGGFRRRVIEMGFVRGKIVEVILNAPLKDPIKYKIMDYEVSLRRSEADMIEVITEQEAREQISKGEVLTVDATCRCESVEEVISTHSRTINVALVGNPNSGKTSLFNALSGGHEHVGNYSGVTVEAKSGKLSYKGYRFLITDLPGTYALSPYTPEELFVRHHLIENTPDVVINAVVASNLERNLFLTTELIDINPKMVIALNMYDELQHSGAELDSLHLGGMLGVPMIPTVARQHKGIDELLDTIIDVHENRNSQVRHVHINHGQAIEDGIEMLYKHLRVEELPKHFPPRYWVLKLLERDKEVESTLRKLPDFDKLIEVRDRECERIERELGEDIESAVTSQKYGFISGALKETYTPPKMEEKQTSRLIDAIVTHKLFGFPIFILLMWIMFAATFDLGAYPQEWLQAGVDWLAEFIGEKMGDGMLKDLITNGIIGGVGSVIVFLPNILILYLFISFMEDSGYMSRAAFIMDKIMHRIGLHGKSFIPLIMGFGCNVPAIMASRTIESRSSRVITILINPFMSCSARLPVYLLLVGTFFPSSASLVLICIYLLGVVMAVVTARLMRRFMFREDETPFVMELPPYRLPTLKATLQHMWDKGAQYLRKMGGIILVGSIVIWSLSYFPRQETGSMEEQAHQYENSYLGRIGHAVEPVMRPMGLDWKASVALISGIPAKEIVVSTLGVLYSDEAASQDAEQYDSLAVKMAQSGDFDSRSALAFMIFILLYFPCLASLAAIRNETGKWRWAIFSAVYNTALAWCVAWVVYMVAGIF